MASCTFTDNQSRTPLKLAEFAATREIIMSRVLTISLNLLLMPVLFNHFPSDKLGTWLLLGQVGAIVCFLDFGITNVLTRRVAFASVTRAGDGPGRR